jgi:hypothetical protein
MEAIEKSFSQTVTTQAPATSAATVTAPSHLIALPGGDWNLWRWSGLRATGFPSDTVLKFTSDACLDDVDRLVESEAEVELWRTEALSAANEVFEPLRYAEEKAKRRRVVKVIRTLTKGKPPAPEKFEPALQSAIETYRSAYQRHEQLDAAYRQKFKEASAEVAKVITEAAGDERFREAVIWQNRHAFNTAIAEVLRRAGADFDTSKHRQHLELVAIYMQRYSLKNDTVGFFGPVGWASLNPNSTSFYERPGESLLTTRTVYFEAWCMDELVEFLNKDKQLRPWMPLRPIPYLHVSGTTLTLPQGRPMQLQRAQALALQLCNGERTAKSIVATLRTRLPLEVKSDTDGYKVLEFLESRALISWKFELAIGVYPNRSLRRLIEAIDDDALRERALEPLVELEAGRDAVARASGNPEKLEEALNELDAAFERITATASTRAAGQMYAARTLVYEDCIRNTEVEVGGEVLERLGPPLTLLLTSARWFTFQVAQYYRQVLKQIYDALVKETNSKQIGGALFWYRSHEYFFNGPKTGSTRVQPDFHKRWSEVLSISAEQKQASFTVEQLRPLVERAFAAPRPGWSNARHHSPDVMIAASSAEAVRRGDYQLVLGEFHLGTNTLRGSLFVLQHPRPEEIFRAIEHDMPKAGIRIIPPKSWPGLTSRTIPLLLSSENYLLLTTHDSMIEPGKHNLPIGSVIVEEAGGILMAKTRDGRLRFDVIEWFADILSSSTTNKFKLLPPAPHTPRITVDHLMVSRESWSFKASELAFAYKENEAQRFLEARRWGNAHGLPRFFFVKSPVEVKPFYVDLNSHMYVDIFSKVVRRTELAKGGETLIAVSEMVPTHDQAWLTDAAGRHYTSEFRIVAVDPAQ